MKQLQNLAEKLDQVKDAVKDEKNALTYPGILKQCLRVYENAPQNIKSELEPLVNIDNFEKKASPTLQEQDQQEEQKQPEGQQEEQQIDNEIIDKVKQQAQDYINSIIDKIKKIPDEELTKKLSQPFTIERSLQYHCDELLQTLNGVQTNNELLTELNNFNETVVNTINRLINTKELYDYLMYIKSQISNIKDETLKNGIAEQLTQLTSDTLTIPDIENAAKNVVTALQQYIEEKIKEITDKNLKEYLQNNQQKLDKLNELKAETILPTIRSQINIIDKILKNTDKDQVQQASDVLEQMSMNLDAIMPQQTEEEELDEILKNTNKKQTQAASDVLEQMKTILKNITTEQKEQEEQEEQEEEIKPKNIKPINTVLQQLHNDLEEIAAIFQNFYNDELSPIKRELEEQQTQERSLQAIEPRTQDQEERLKAIKDTIKSLEVQYNECEKKRKQLQNDIHTYWQTTTEILTTQNYPDDKRLIQAIKNKILELIYSEEWDYDTFTNYAFNNLQTIMENIEKLSNTKELYDNLKDINTNISNIKDTTLKDKLQALNINQPLLNWNSKEKWENNQIRYELSDVALKFIIETKTYIENKINNSKNATLKAEAEKILSQLNNFNPQLDKQWLKDTIKNIKTEIEEKYHEINDETLAAQISQLHNDIANLDITGEFSPDNLNDVNEKIKLFIDDINDKNLQKQIKEILNPIFNIEDMNSILKTKLPQAIEMVHKVLDTIKLMQAANEQNAQEVLNNLKDNLKGAEQVFQVPVQQEDTLDKIYPTKDLLRQISNEITAIETEIETLSEEEQEEELQKKLQDLYNKHNINCDKYTLIKVLLKPFNQKNINIDKAEMKAKLNQIKDLLTLFSSEDINIDTAIKAVNDHFNLIKSIIRLQKYNKTDTIIIDDVYTQFKKQIYSINSINEEINDIEKLLKRDEVQNNTELKTQFQQNLNSLYKFKQELTETTEPIIPDLIQELQNLEQEQNNNQIVTEISTIIKNIRTEFKSGFYSIQSITDAINKINELLQRDEIQNNQDEQTKEYITQTLKSLSDFKQKLTEVSKLVTLDWDNIFKLTETVEDHINLYQNNRTNALDIIIESCLDDPYSALDNIKYVIYKIKQIQTNTNAKNETSKDPKDDLFKEIAKQYKTKELLNQLLKDIMKIVNSKITHGKNRYDNAVQTKLTQIISYLFGSQQRLSEQSLKMLSFDMYNIEQYREKQYLKELPEQLLKYINRIHGQPCQMYKKFHTIQEKISVLKAIKQHVLTPVPYVFIQTSIIELIKQINEKPKTGTNQFVLDLLKEIIDNCVEPTTWREIKNQIIDKKSKIEALNNRATKAIASHLSKLIHNTKKCSIQKLYDDTKDPQIKKILEPLNLENAKFCDITDEQLTWRINQSLQQLQTFLDTKIIVPSSISTLTDIVKNAQLFPNIQLAQLCSEKVEENDKENTQDENFDPKTFYLQSIKIAAQNIQYKCSNNTIYNDIKQAIERKYKWYVKKASSYINDYNSEINKCQESLEEISQYTSDDTERQVFKMYYYRQMFLQQQKLAKSLDLTTFMSYCAEHLQKKQSAYSECFTDVCSAIHNIIIPPQYKMFIENSKKQWHNCPKPEQIADLALPALNNIFKQIRIVRNKLQELQSNQNININNAIENIQTYYKQLSNLSTQTEKLKILFTNILNEQNFDKNLKSRLNSFVFISIDDAKKLLKPLQDTTKKYIDDYTHAQKVIKYREKISEYLDTTEQEDKDITWLLTNINPDNRNLDKQLISQKIITQDDVIQIEAQRQLLTTLNNQIKKTIKSSAELMMKSHITTVLGNNELKLDSSLSIAQPTLSQTDLNNNKLSWNELKFVRCNDNEEYYVSEYEKDCIQKGKTSIQLQQTPTLLNQLRTKDTFNYVEALIKQTKEKKKELTDAGFWMHNTGDIAKLLETDVLPLNLVKKWIAYKNDFSRKILSNCWPFNHIATLEARIKQNDLMLLINKETNKCMAINPTTAFDTDGKIKPSIMENVKKVFPDGNIPEIFVPENGEYHNCIDNVGTTKGIICPNIPHKWFSATSQSMKNRAKKYNKVLLGLIKNKYVNCIHSSGDSNETAAWMAKLLASNNCTIDSLHLRDIEEPEKLAEILSLPEKGENSHMQESNIQNIVLSYSRRYDNRLANRQIIGDKKINELLYNTSHKYNWKINLYKKGGQHAEYGPVLQSQSSIKVIRDIDILPFKKEIKTLLQRLAKQRSGDTLNICAELFSNTTKIEERDGAIYITDESSQKPYFPIVIKDYHYQGWIISLNGHNLKFYINEDEQLDLSFDNRSDRCKIRDTSITYTAQSMQERQDFEACFPIALSIFQQVIAPTLAKFHSHDKNLLHNINIPPLQRLQKDGKDIKYKKHKWTSLTDDRSQEYKINYFPSYCKNAEITQNNIIASNTNHMLNAQLTPNDLQLTCKDKSTNDDKVIDNNIQPKDTTLCMLFDGHNDASLLDKYAIKYVLNGFNYISKLTISEFANDIAKHNENNSQKPIDNIKIIIDDNARSDFIMKIDKIFDTVRETLNKIDINKLKYITFSPRTHERDEEFEARQKEIKANIEKLARDYKIPIYYAQPLASEEFKAKTSLITKYAGSANKKKQYFRTDPQYNLQAITREQKRQTQFELKNIKNNAEYNLGANVNGNQL